MPEMTKYEPGTPSWVDLASPAPEDAARFYSALFGWTIEESPPDAGGYRVCLLGDELVAGVGQQMDPDASPAWSTYISVADADETAVAITEDGGSVLVEPTDVHELGRMAVAADPAGAVFSIWQPKVHAGAGVVNDPNSWCWNELTTREPQRSVEFYGAVFGWTAGLLPGGPHDYTEFRVADRGIAGMMPMEGDGWPAELPNHWMVYFAVDDCQAAVARVEELGGSIVSPPTEVPPGTFAIVKDPHGAVFGVIAMPPAAGSAA